MSNDETQKKKDYAREVRKSPMVEGLLRQFLRAESGQSQNPNFDRGYEFAFRWSEESKAKVNRLMELGMTFEEAFDYQIRVEKEQC